MRSLTTEDEQYLLQCYARNRRVLEIGAYDGASTIAMAKVAEEVITIDPFIDFGHDNIEPDVREFRKAIMESGLRNITLIRLTSEAALPWLATNFFRFPYLDQFDFIFIDGNHKAGAIRNDLSYARHLARVIGVHDYRVIPDVLAETDKALADWKLANEVDRLAIFTLT